MNVSVKLSALYSQFDPIDPEGTARAVCRRLRPILALAKQTGAFVNFDMEQYSFKDVTLRIFRDDPDRAGVPRLAARRHRDSGVPEGHRSATCTQLLDWAKNDASARSGCGS